MRDGSGTASISLMSGSATSPRYKRGGLSGATLGLVLARDSTYQISMNYVPNFRAIPTYR
jgi:hypothetical protein